jgi:hypothetical protein
MLTHLPLDDELNQLFYVEEGTWRLVWANALGRCVLRREQPNIELADAATMISRGELLWAPPERFDPLGAGTPPDFVRREHTLLLAFFRSPAGRRVTSWTPRHRLELRLREHREWRARHALRRGDPRPADEG